MPKKIVESTGEDAKATARHAKLAREREAAEEKERTKASDEYWRNRRANEKRRDEVKYLPREERAEARRQIREDSRENREKYRDEKRAMREKERNQGAEAEAKTSKPRRGDASETAIDGAGADVPKTIDSASPEPRADGSGGERSVL